MKNNTVIKVETNHLWTPTAGDKVAVSNEKYDGIFSVKSYNSKSKMISVFVPCGLDDDGDTIYDVDQVHITTVKLTSRTY